MTCSITNTWKLAAADEYVVCSIRKVSWPNRRHDLSSSIRIFSHE